MGYILLVAMTIYGPFPKNFMIVEFQTKIACEIALKEAKRFYKTVDNESKCISVAEEIKKEQLKKELEGLK